MTASSRSGRAAATRWRPPARCCARPSSRRRRSCSARSRSPPRSASTRTPTSAFWSCDGGTDAHPGTAGPAPRADTGGAAPLARGAAAAQDRGGARPLHRGTGSREEGRRHRGAQPLAPHPGARRDPGRDPSQQHHHDRPDGRGGGGAGEKGERPLFVVSSKGDVTPKAPEAEQSAQERWRRTREKLRQQLQKGELEEREVEVEVQQQGFPGLEMMQPPPGMEGPDFNFVEMLQEMMPKKKKRRTVHLHEARRILIDEELKKLVDMDDVVNEALDRVENHGIIFIDELDKIAGECGTVGPDVSREGVQRDLLPIVEGSTVQTRYGYVRTDHVLFIAAGAFHIAKPSDLIPELQGRFPIRVELSSLTEEDFVRIMTEPENALTKQYAALCASDGATLEFTTDGVKEVARIAAKVNERMENIGARRLHTVLTTLLEEVLFELPDYPTKKIVFNADAVRERLSKIVDDEDLRRYIL